MEDSNLIKVAAALVTAGLIICSIWFYKTFTTKIKEKNRNHTAPEEINKSTMEETLTSQQVFSQEKDERDESVTETSKNLFQEEIESSQASGQEEQDVNEIKDLGTQSQEHGADPLADDSEVELTSETVSQATCRKVVTDQSSICEPEESEKHEEILSKTDSPIMHNQESEKSDTNNRDFDSKPAEIETRPFSNEGDCIKTESKVSRSVILNYQLPVSVPLPNETASEMLSEFRLSSVIHAFTGQDLIDLEDYDEEEEIRRFLFKKDN